ncbi:hypothetical protein [Streptomyces sp. NK15101]|nr:hypothetical protein [Streptomyces sp. NK15101]
MGEREHSPCPRCAGEYTYETNDLVVCPECGHEIDGFGAMRLKSSVVKKA